MIKTQFGFFFEKSSFFGRGGSKSLVISLLKSSYFSKNCIYFETGDVRASFYDSNASFIFFSKNRDF
jgi:hypothetical protein